MATGFMPNIIAFLLLAAWLPAALADVALIGVIGEKAAVLSLDGGDPKTVKVGQAWNGIKVVEVRKGQATVEEEGKRRVLLIGQHYRGVPPPPPPPPASPGAKQKVAVPAYPSGKQAAVLTADETGHFYTQGAVNGMSMRFLVDTGATLISLPGGEASRLGIDYRSGKRDMSNTANGTVTIYQIKLDTVKIGDIELNNLDALVIEQGLSIPLLGMSFLNRVEMRRDGDEMVLTRRF